MALLHKLPPLENVGAGLTAVLPRLSMGMVYHGIVLKLGGTFTKSQITGLRMRLDGKQFVDLTGSRLDTINSFDGRTANASYLSLPFGEPNARTIIGEGIGSIETANHDLMEMEVDIDAGATSPTLEAWAVLGGKEKIDRRYATYVRAYLTATHSPGAGGEYNLNVPMGSRVGAELKRIHFFHSNLTKLQIVRDGLYLMQEAETGLLDFVYSELTRSAQSGHAAFDPVWTDNQSDAVPTFRDDGNPAVFEIKATVSAADTITTITDLYAPSIAHV